MTLPVNSPVLFYLQRLRDEVHRFAIGAHRAKRSRAITASPLDEVPGIGPGRKRALLMHFGTARAVQGRRARGPREGARHLAGRWRAGIYDYFHPAWVTCVRVETRGHHLRRAAARRAWRHRAGVDARRRASRPAMFAAVARDGCVRYCIRATSFRPNFARGPRSNSRS